MNRRSMIKGAVAGLLSLLAVTKASDVKKEIVETRTREYLDRIPLWNERNVFNDSDNAQHREFLFTGGCDKKEMLDFSGLGSSALVYSPRWKIQEGHFFDILYVKIGDKNVTAITELRKRFPGDFTKLPDCMNT